MKNIKSIYLLLTALLLVSCEEVIDVDLNTAKPRLVIDASIDWVKGTDGSQQTIKLATTAGYYEDEIPVVSGATVFITNSANVVFDFIEDPGTGNYICNNFVPQIGETYVLTVIHDGQTYTAIESLYAAPEITEVAQDNEGGFLGENIEVRFYYPDNPAEENFYMYRFDTDVMPYPDYDVLEDRFFEGNEMFGIFSHEDLEQGDELGIKLYGISERYYNYMLLVISIIEGGAGSGPFQTVPANARGNIVNQTNEDNFAWGYFRLGEVEILNYSIE